MTQADRFGVATGILGERWDNITICEANRATGFEFRPDGIRQLLDYCQKNYVLKGVKACVFGVDPGGDEEIAYAVYVAPGFLRRVTEEEDIRLRRKNERTRNNTAASTSKAKA
jgi:hypothetical protein